MTKRFRVLTELQFQKEALPAFRSVFVSEDPFDRPLNPKVAQGAVLFPVQYELDAGLLSAVRAAASELGDDGLYVTALERDRSGGVDPLGWDWHWFIPFEELDRYRELGPAFVLQNALYSPSGQWGLMISHEHHAVVAGPSGFIDAISLAMPESLDAQLAEFLDVWRENKSRLGSDVTWIPWLLANVYGEDRARTLLRAQAGWLSDP